MPLSPKALGKALRFFRKKAGLTADDVAAHPTIHGWGAYHKGPVWRAENGDTTAIPFVRVVALLKLYQTPFDEFMELAEAYQKVLDMEDARR